MIHVSMSIGGKQSEVNLEKHLEKKRTIFKSKLASRASGVTISINDLKGNAQSVSKIGQMHEMYGGRRSSSSGT